MSIVGRHKRLAAIVGMLGSDHDGERANAARMATIELRALGLTWSDLIHRAFGMPKQGDLFGEPYHQGTPRSPRQANGYAGKRYTEWTDSDGEIVELWAFVRRATMMTGRGLSPWERSFVKSFYDIGPHCSATENQWRILLQVRAKLHMGAEAV